MVITAQAISLSANSIISIAFNIAFSALTAWLSAQIVTGRATMQGAALFSVLSYVVLLFIGYVPIPSIPYINVIFVAEVLVSSLLAMKFFYTDFRGGISITAVQIIIGYMILISL